MKSPPGRPSSAYELLAPREDLQCSVVSTVPDERVVTVALEPPPPLRLNLPTTDLSAAAPPAPISFGTGNGRSTLVCPVPVDLDDPDAPAAVLTVAPLRWFPSEAPARFPTRPPERKPTPKATPAKKRPVRRRSTSLWLGQLRRSVNQPARYAFVLILVAGSAIAILTPPLKGADERDHFTRAYQLAGGDLSVHKSGSRYGAVLPSGYGRELAQLSDTVDLNHDHTAFLDLLGQKPPTGTPVFTQAGTVASYGPAAYVAYLPVIALGKAIGVSLAVDVYLARMAGLLAYALLISLAVRRAPLHRWIFVAAALIPESLSQASTVSADGMTIALTALVIANALHLSSDRDHVSSQIIIETILASVLLALTKPPYVAFVLLLIIPAWKFRRRLVLPLGLTVVGSLLVSGLWLAYQRTRSVSLDLPHLTLFSGRRSEYAYRDIHIPQQTLYLVQQPWELAQLIWRTIVHQGTAFPKQMFGLLAQYQVPSLVIVLSMVVLAASCLVPDGPTTVRLQSADRCGLLVLSAAVALAICAIIYITANALRAPRIDQLTARYFLPLVAPVLIGILPNFDYARFPKPNLAKPFVQVGLFVVLVITIIGLGHSFYGPSHLV
jgi:uncharacterized membrane protein